VIDNDDCERYQDTLDRLFEGAVPEEDVRRLRGHAESCPDCSALLEIHRRLRGAPLAELQAAVPDRLVEGMWPRVELELLKDDWRRASRPRRSPVWRWVVAAQAAAIVLLAAGAVYLQGELNSLKNRDANLNDWMALQQTQLTELRERTSGPSHGVEVGTAGSIRDRRLQRAGEVTVGDVSQYLRRLPANTRVLDARDARRLLSDLVTEVPQAGGGIRPGGLPAVDLADGLQAGEALELLTALDLDPASRLPAGGIPSPANRYD
jgi:hypothetical protein